MKQRTGCDEYITKTLIRQVSFPAAGGLLVLIEKNSSELSKPDILQKIPILYVMTIWKIKRLTFANKMTFFLQFVKEKLL